MWLVRLAQRRAALRRARAEQRLARQSVAMLPGWERRLRERGW
jgi:hypothetical protein